jgi:hypothetical protein
MVLVIAWPGPDSALVAGVHAANSGRIAAVLDGESGVLACGERRA